MWQTYDMWQMYDEYVGNYGKNTWRLSAEFQVCITQHISSNYKRQKNTGDTLWYDVSWWKSISSDVVLNKTIC